MLAAICGWHEQYKRAAREIEDRLGDGAALIVAAPALVETYAVLTRLPSPHRLSPTDTLQLLEANFISDDVTTVALDVEGYLKLLRWASQGGIVGGHIYDAVILACALAGNVDTLLTFNERQFRSLENQGIKIIVPA